MSVLGVLKKETAQEWNALFPPFWCVLCQEHSLVWWSRVGWDPAGTLLDSRLSKSGGVWNTKCYCSQTEQEWVIHGSPDQVMLRQCAAAHHNAGDSFPLPQVLLTLSMWPLNPDLSNELSIEIWLHSTDMYKDKDPRQKPLFMKETPVTWYLCPALVQHGLQQH